jgi:hypothetical protein
MKLPGCRVDHPEADIWAAVGQIREKQRKTHGAGSGRPRKPERCPCGLMSLARAAERKHRCAIVSELPGD